jgi:hypothetical protein
MRAMAGGQGLLVGNGPAFLTLEFRFDHYRET